MKSELISSQLVSEQSSIQGVGNNPAKVSSRRLPYILFFFFFNFTYLFGHTGIWDLSSTTRHWTYAPCIGSTALTTGPSRKSLTFLQGVWHKLYSAPLSGGQSPCLQTKRLVLKAVTNRASIPAPVWGLLCPVRQGLILGPGSELCYRSVSLQPYPPPSVL